jgi:hypothetical protein
MGVRCLAVTPGLGWKIKIGRSRFSINPGIRMEYFRPFDKRYINVWNPVMFNLLVIVGAKYSF